LIVFVIGALVVWRFALKDVAISQRGETTAQPPAPLPAPPVAAPTANVSSVENMVLIDGGDYVIGRDDGDPYARPKRSVTLAPFHIDRTEVTNAQYKKFVDTTGHAPPEGWSGNGYTPGTDNWPVTGVTWQDAADYARWAGKRLPTETEWEAAARGKEGRYYPWGNDWRTGVANIGGTSGAVEVGRFAMGSTSAGVHDLIGNVWEWTSDEFQLYPGNPVAMPPVKPGLIYRVVRGGAFDGSDVHDASYRGFLDGNQRYPKIGFRCVKNADQ
jgi:serine/threonine-protein kinase